MGEEAPVPQWHSLIACCEFEARLKPTGTGHQGVRTLVVKAQRGVHPWRAGGGLTLPLHPHTHVPQHLIWGCATPPCPAHPPAQLRGQPPTPAPLCVLSTLRLCIRTGGPNPNPEVLGCMLAPAQVPVHLGESVFPSKPSLREWVLCLRIASKFEHLRQETVLWPAFHPPCLRTYLGGRASQPNLAGPPALSTKARCGPTWLG